MSDPWDVYDQIENLAFWRDRDRGPVFFWRPIYDELSINWRSIARSHDSPPMHPAWVSAWDIIAGAWPEDWT